MDVGDRLRQVPILVPLVYGWRIWVWPRRIDSDERLIIRCSASASASRSFLIVRRPSAGADPPARCSLYPYPCASSATVVVEPIQLLPWPSYPYHSPLVLVLHLVLSCLSSLVPGSQSYTPLPSPSPLAVTRRRRRPRVVLFYFIIHHHHHRSHSHSTSTPPPTNTPPPIPRAHAPRALHLYHHHHLTTNTSDLKKKVESKKTYHLSPCGVVSPYHTTLPFYSQSLSLSVSQ